jgi:hypothetical protein
VSDSIPIESRASECQVIFALFALDMRWIGRSSVHL